MDTPRTYQPISAAEFMALGLPEVAYMKPVLAGGREKISLNAANGQQLAVVDTPRQAAELALMNGLVPLTVH